MYSTREKLEHIPQGRVGSRQAGFTLIEITIVLVIIGLLVGGILKGRELINSARVRNLTNLNVGIQTAYYGFIDRYRQIPGDMPVAEAQTAIGDSSIDVGGNGDGQINVNSYAEVSALWVHLSRAGFLQGDFQGGAVNAASYKSSSIAPINPFNGYMLLGRSRDYSTTTGKPKVGNPIRLGLILGNNIPVSIARELDVKIDDSKPLTGALRFTGTTTIDYDGVSSAGELCMVSETTNAYHAIGDAQNCNLIYLY